MFYQNISKSTTGPLVFRSLARSFESKASAAEATPTSCPHQETSADDVDWNDARPFKQVPGPSRFELVKSFLPGGTYYKKSVTVLFEDLRKKYGNFLIMPGLLGQKSILMTFDPNLYRKVFRNEGIWPTRRNFDSALYFRSTYRKDFFNGVEGIIMTSGESWSRFRSAVNPILMNPKNAKLYLNKMLPVNDEFLQRIRHIRDPNTLEMPDTFETDINHLAFESVAAIALDRQLGLLRSDGDTPEAKLLFQSLHDFFDLAFALDLKPSLWRIIRTPSFNKMMTVSSNMLEITSKYINEALERIEANPHTKEEGYQQSVLEKLAAKDKTIAIVMAMDMLMAGVDTTSTTLTGILLGIAKNPNVQAKLREEVSKILPEKDSKPKIEDMQHLPYLRACIKEGIRMYPIGPGTVRTMPKDIVLNGYQIPAGTDVAMGNNTILREEKYFPRPNEFIPERWLRTDEANAYKPNEFNPFVYLPFGFGPRSCAGKRIVELELELTVSRLVRNFNIEFNYPIENAFITIFFTRPAIPLKFKFTELEN